MGADCVPPSEVLDGRRVVPISNHGYSGDMSGGISQLFVERMRVDRREPEETMAVEVAQSLGIPVEKLSLRQVERAVVTGSSLCVGAVPFVSAALRAAGAGLPPHQPYPAVLSCHLYRQVGYAERLATLLSNRREPLFVKPAAQWKKWTGRVINGSTDRGRNDPVYWSEPVEWLSEWRAYIVDGAVLDIQRVPNTPVLGPEPDRRVVLAAASDYAAAPDAAQGLVIDFGVLATGETALVEVNDGFSFGAYGAVTSETMWSVWTARWPQLVTGGRRE